MVDRVEHAIEQNQVCKNDASVTLIAECIGLTGNKTANRPIPVEPKELVFKLEGDSRFDKLLVFEGPGSPGNTVDSPKEKKDPKVAEGPKNEDITSKPGLSQSDLDKFMKNIKAQEQPESELEKLMQWIEREREREFDEMHIPERDRGRIVRL